MGMKVLDSTFFVMKRLGWVAVENRMFRHGDKVLVGLSGGHASLAMLLALVQRQRKTPIDLEILPFHVPDGVYGSAEVVVPLLREACARMGLGLDVWEDGPVDSAGHFAQIPHQDILCRSAEQLGACSIALGHTLEDRALGALLPAITAGRLASMPEMEALTAGRTLNVLRLLSHVEPEAVLRMAKDEGLPVLPRLVEGPMAELQRVVQEYLGAKSGPRIEKLRNLATAPDRVRDEYMA